MEPEAELEPVEGHSLLQKVIDNWEKSANLRNERADLDAKVEALKRPAPADAFVSKKNIDYVGLKRDAGRKFANLADELEEARREDQDARRRA